LLPGCATIPNSYLQTLPVPVPIFLTIHAYNFPSLLIEDTANTA